MDACAEIFRRVSCRPPGCRLRDCRCGSGAFAVAERRHQGLPVLVYNAQLDRMAKIQAENMARFQKMAHTIPESQLPTLGDRARYAGYRYGRLAENVALGYPNAETAVQGWMNSSGHRRNILDGGVEETGIGIARSSAGGLYYCQVFGRRLTAP